MSKKKIFLIVGRTSSGKSSITRAVCQALGLKQVKSYTTRPMRESEKKNPDASEHYFITEEEVKQYENDIAAYTEINGYKYFTTKEILNQSDCYVIDPNGIEDLKKRCSDDYDFITIYLRRPKSGIKRSYLQRGDSFKSFSARYDAENEQFTQYELKGDWDYHILNNGTFDEGVEKMKRIITKVLNKVD